MTEEPAPEQKEIESQVALVKQPLKQKNTGMAMAAYIIFFIPLLTEARNDSFVKYHVKQGLVLFIVGIIVEIISLILPWQLWMIIRLLDIALVALAIIGIMNASKGEQKPLPLIGKFGEQFKF